MEKTGLFPSVSHYRLFSFLFCSKGLWFCPISFSFWPVVFSKGLQCLQEVESKTTKKDQETFADEEKREGQEETGSQTNLKRV